MDGKEMTEIFKIIFASVFTKKKVNCSQILKATNYIQWDPRGGQDKQKAG